MFQAMESIIWNLLADSGPCRRVKLVSNTMGSMPPSPNHHSDQKLVLVVAAAPTLHALLQDVMTLFASDLNVLISGTTSPHLHGMAAKAVGDALIEVGIPTLPWSAVAAGAHRVDLVVTTDETALPYLEEFGCPVVLFSAELTPTNPPQARVRVVHGGVQTHDELVIDPTWERMVAAVGRRHRYRDALNVGDRRLVVLRSAPDRAQMLRQRDRLRTVFGSLSVDEFRFAMTVHPSLWWSRGEQWVARGAEIPLLLADLIDAGMALISPFEERAALLAADIVVGDQISTREASHLGLPTARLDPVRPRSSEGEHQVLDAIRSARSTESFPPPREVDGATRIRALLYHNLDHAEPSRPAYYSPLTDLSTDHHEATAWRVNARTQDDPLSVMIERLPAAAPPQNPAVLPLLVDSLDEVPTRWEAAKGWCRRSRLERFEAHAWADWLFSQYPSTKIVACDIGEGVLVVQRGETGDGKVTTHPSGQTLDVGLVAARALLGAATPFFR